jgi:uncharacterized membrane protein
MTSSNALSTADLLEDKPLFAAILTPHRSLGRQGFYALLAAVIGINLIGAFFFTIAGAWPVVPFLGLDVLLVWIAFRANYRAARAYEEVIVTPVEITVRRVDQKGRRLEWRFNPAWTKLHTTRDDDDERLVTALVLDEGRRRLAVATLLPPVERADFGRALACALADAKRGPDRNL